MTNTVVDTFEKSNRQAVILERTDGLEIDFRENGEFLGTIPYHDKSIYYVQDAAYNFIEGILTLETINYYKKA